MKIGGSMMMSLVVLVNFHFEKLELSPCHLLIEHLFTKLPQVLVSLINASLKLGVELFTHFV